MARWRLPGPSIAPKPGDVVTMNIGGRRVQISGDRIKLAPAPFREKPRSKARQRSKASTGHKTNYPGVFAMFRALKLPEPVAEYYFATPRRWRLDFAWPALMIAIEIDGGLFATDKRASGAHTRGARILETHDKLNAAAALGWRVFHYAPRTLKRAPVEMERALRVAMLRRETFSIAESPLVSSIIASISDPSYPNLPPEPP